ncbi:molybdopterin synthase sulfur carrier subunit-like isoform X2 [Hetaerina americana]|uniref:molybdopterin synthase sulfur carrier subunit-like isoform X2 n=1 Tax=Hetaerina americana TaxID=62018 RepID=UPI003A7F5FB1
MGDGIEVTVKVLFFAKARELSGTEVSDLKVDAASTYDYLLNKIVNKFSLGKIRNNILLAINEEYSGPDAPIHLKDGDEIAVIPPISGG